MSPRRGAFTFAAYCRQRHTTRRRCFFLFRGKKPRRHFIEIVCQCTKHRHTMKPLHFAAPNGAKYELMSTFSPRSQAMANLKVFWPEIIKYSPRLHVKDYTGILMTRKLPPAGWPYFRDAAASVPKMHEQCDEVIGCYPSHDYRHYFSTPAATSTMQNTAFLEMHGEMISPRHLTSCRRHWSRRERDFLFKGRVTEAAAVALATDADFGLAVFMMTELPTTPGYRRRDRTCLRAAAALTMIGGRFYCRRR